MARIARAEFNDIKRRISGDDDDDAETSDRPQGNAKARDGETVEIDDSASQTGPKAPDSGAPADWPAQRWPREVRQAYAALELPLGAGEDEVGGQYRALLKRYDPSKHVGDPEAERAAAELVRALGDHKNAILAHLERMRGQ